MAERHQLASNPDLKIMEHALRRLTHVVIGLRKSYINVRTCSWAAHGNSATQSSSKKLAARPSSSALHEVGCTDTLGARLGDGEEVGEADAPAEEADGAAVGASEAPYSHASSSNVSQPRVPKTRAKPPLYTMDPASRA